MCVIINTNPSIIQWLSLTILLLIWTSVHLCLYILYSEFRTILHIARSDKCVMPFMTPPLHLQVCVELPTWWWCQYGLSPKGQTTPPWTQERSNILPATWTCSTDREIHQLTSKLEVSTLTPSWFLYQAKGL